MWVLGMGLAGMSEDAYKMSQLWLSLSIVNWVVLVAVSWFLIRPAITDTERVGDRAARCRHRHHPPRPRRRPRAHDLEAGPVDADDRTRRGLP